MTINAWPCQSFYLALLRLKGRRTIAHCSHRSEVRWSTSGFIYFFYVFIHSLTATPQTNFYSVSLDRSFTEYNNTYHIQPARNIRFKLILNRSLLYSSIILYTRDSLNIARYLAPSSAWIKTIKLLFINILLCKCERSSQNIILIGYFDNYNLNI